MHPARPRKGMYVIYGRSGFERSRAKGIITAVTASHFWVQWIDIASDEPTQYVNMAWSTTQFRNELRERNKHYIFFDESSKANQISFGEIFNCGEKRNMGTQTNNSGIVMKQVLVEGEALTNMTCDQLIGKIRQLEEKQNALKNIKTQSKAISNLIKEYDEAIAEVVTALDNKYS